MVNPDITLSGEASSELVFQCYVHAETEELIEVIPGNETPIPEVDEVVSFGEMMVTGYDGIGEFDEVEFTEGDYIVDERIYDFIEADVREADGGAEDKAYVTSVYVYVTPLDELDEE